MTKDGSKILKATDGREQTLTSRVSRMLETDLREKKLELGKPLPSERELAGRFGVSTITVRQALSGLEKAGKIFKVPKVGTFAGPRPSGGLIRRQGKICLGLMIPMLRTGIGPLILAGVEEFCVQHSIYVEVYHSCSDTHIEKQQLKRLRSSEVDGAIIMSYGFENMEEIVRLKMEGMPIVIADHEVSGLNADLVTSDNLEGGKQAARLLVKRNLNQYIYVGMETRMSTSESRLKGYREGLAEAGVGEPLFLKFRGVDEWPQWPAVVSVCRPVFEKIIPPIGVFCENDYVAVGVYRAARELGWVIGKDIFVIGFDDDPICRAMTPDLTTIRQPAEAIGSTAVQLLLERLTGQVSKDQVRNRVLPVELVERESTGLSDEDET
jgi:LacI family transcriptional regulator